MIDVVALGELLIDFAAKSADAGGYPTMAANPGGAPGNFLAALGVYGCKTAFIGKVGADTFGRLLRRTMHDGVRDYVNTRLPFLPLPEAKRQEIAVSLRKILES